MIHIGNQTACWAATPTEPFDYAVANGFDAFEWFPDKKSDAGWDERDLNELRRQNIRDTARARSMRLSVHARWQANLVEPDSYPLVWKDLELARDLGAVLLNIHLYDEKGIAAYVEAITPLVRQAAEAKLQLSIENTPLHAPEHFNELFLRLHEIGSEATRHVGMCFDLGHANLCAATRNDYLKFIDRLDPRVPIIHLHVHENWGDADTHLPLFTGPAGRDDSGIRGFLERLRRRNYSGAIILEQWPHPPSLLNSARDRLLGLLKAEVSQAEGEGDVALALVAADKRCRSWREKLDFVRGLLARDTPPLNNEELLDVAIYLRFLGTGEIQCVEDGRHFRPAHHARIALEIQARLARLTTTDNQYVIRKIYPWLPSSAQTFQRAEPLTRIRDIAHRNDIPSDLKREIKNSLQNKLHRCAGPEDLATSSALLARITAPGANFAPAFVEQFKVFHEELTEFFSAQSLEARLRTLLPAVGAKTADLIQSFLSEKAGTRLPEQMAAFRTLTGLRHHFVDLIAENPGAGNQDFILADIGLEDFAFVLLSDMINAFEAAALPTWEPPLEALLLTINNLALSGVDPEECRALEAELGTWRKDLDPADRDELLRLKATADRARRLGADYSDRIMELLPKRVEKLGRALGVPEHAIRVFAEAEIRGHLIFQFSKLVERVRRRIREQLGLPPWDVIVSGRAVGQVQAADSLGGLSARLVAPVVVLLKRAAGDEEIPNSVAGIVLAHEIPHLSHLGVRARQARVVLVTCDEVSYLKSLQSLQGHVISLVASPEKVEWSGAATPNQSQDQVRPRSVRIPAVRLSPEPPCISLDQAVAEVSGSKADGARRLAQLARSDRARFETPPALVVPFGVMEAALHTNLGVEEYRGLLSRIGETLHGEFAGTTERLHDLIQGLDIPSEVTSAVARTFGRNVPLIVRSSANCEDLEELAGAGLYESVMSVAPADVASAIRAVWSSLWTHRAAASRQQAGVPHGQAHMAVLVQEMLTPSCSFVLHTVNPINHNRREVYAEIVVGLGETLVSAATRGSPYRIVCHKDTDAVTILAFANFSQALWPAAHGGMARQTVDYSRVTLTCDADARTRLGRRLAAIARLVEDAFQKPQDIEGALAGDQIYLVQARPQQGLPGEEPT